MGMSTSLLDYAWGIRGYSLVHTAFERGFVHFGIEHQPQTLCCGHCGSTRTQKSGKVRRRFRTLPIGSRPVAENLPKATHVFDRFHVVKLFNDKLSALRRDLQREAEVFLDDWIARARSSGVRMLREFAETMVTHRRGLLNGYDCPISTAPIEGTNTKIKLMQRQAYGYRDMEFFRLKIYALHKTTYALIG
jgi:transposase